MFLQNKTLWTVVGVIAFIAAYFYMQVDWEARAVRKQFDRLVEIVEKDGPVSTFETLGRSRKLVGFFAEGASVEYFPGRTFPKDLDAMGAAFISVWGRVDTASIRVLRHEVEVEPGDSVAESVLTAHCSVVLDGSEQMGDLIKYRIDWRLLEGDWRIGGMRPLN